jgi:hypothetical protein
MNQFFYIMTLIHNGKVGFGITGNVHNRIFDYIAGSAELQSFQYLYYGPKETIAELEKTLKHEWRRYLWTVFKGNKWKLEILDPVHKLTADDVKKWVDDKIVELNLPIKVVKAEWLPYQGDKRVTRKNINLSPDLYLQS